MQTLNLEGAEFSAFVSQQNAADYAKHPARTLAKLFCVDIVEASGGYLLQKPIVYFYHCGDRSHCCSKSSALPT